MKILESLSNGRGRQRECMKPISRLHPSQQNTAGFWNKATGSTGTKNWSASYSTLALPEIPRNPITVRQLMIGVIRSLGTDTTSYPITRAFSQHQDSHAWIFLSKVYPIFWINVCSVFFEWYINVGKSTTHWSYPKRSIRSMKPACCSILWYISIWSIITCRFFDLYGT